jgi:PAS domain S-box-containing protein
MPARPIILNVDDVERVRAVISEILRCAGFEVREAATGAEALRLAAEHPDLILLDIQLPDIDGFEVCRQLKADAATAAIPVLHLSGTCRDVEDRIRGLLNGAEGYLTQPVDAAELVARVRALLRRPSAGSPPRAADTRRRTTEALAEVGRLLTDTLEVTEVAHRVAQSLRALLSVRVAVLARRDPEAGTFEALAVAGPADPRPDPVGALPPGEGVVGLAADTREPVLTPDVLQDARVRLTPAWRRWVEQAGCRAVLAVPVVVRREVIGVLAAGEPLGRGFAAAEIELAQTLAEQAAVALENAGLYERATRQRQQLAGLAEIARRLAEVHDTDHLLALIVQEAARLLGLEGAGLRLLEGEELVLRARTDSVAALLARPRLHVGESLSGLVVARGEPLAVEDLGRDPRYDALHSRGAQALGFHGFLGVPLRVNGHVIGTLTVYAKRRRRFGAEAIALLAALADQAALALDKARLLGEAEHRRHQAEAAERRFRELVHGLDAIVWEADAGTGQFTFVSQRAEALLGYPVPRWLTAPDFRRTLIHPEDQAPVRRAMQRALAEGRDYEIEYRAVAADRHAVWLHDRVQVLRDDEGRARQLRGVTVDVTPRKRTEVALARRSAEATSLVAVGQAITASGDQRAVLDLIVDRACALLGTPRAALASLEAAEPAPVIRFVAQRGLSPHFPERVRPRHWRDGTTPVAIRERRPVWSADLLGDPAFDLTPALRAAVAAEGYRAVLSAPLLVGDRVLGALVVYRDTPGPFGAEEVRLLQALAAAAAIALEQARLSDETDRRLKQTETLLRVSQVVGSTLELTEVVRRTTREMVRALGADLGSAWRLSPSRDQLLPLAGYRIPKALLATLAEATPHLGYPFITAVRDSQGVVYSSRSQNDPQFAHPLLERLPHQAILIAPMWVGREIIGGFVLLWLHEAPPLTRDALRLAEGIARQAAAAIENAQLLEELRRRQARLETLLETSRQLSQIQPVPALLRGMAEACGHLLGVESVGFRLVEGDELVVTGTWGDAGEAMARPRLKVGESLSGLVATTGEPLLVADFAGDPRLIPAHRDTIQRLGLRAALIVPVKVGARVIGVLSIHTRRPAGFEPGDLAMATAFAAQAAIALENSRLYGELRAAVADLEASQHQLVQAERLRALGEMAAGVAHDFNNLLAVVIGRAELLEADAPDHVQRGLQVIRQAALDGAQTVRRIQEFTRTRRTRPFGRVDLGELLREVVELVRPRWQDEAQRGGITYEVGVEAGPVSPVAGLAEELREMFTNLLTNALDAMPTGGRFTFRLVADAAGVVVTAADTGHGMGEDTRRRVFEPFFTTKGPRGTGLGLAMVWGIVTRHGGSVEVQSTPGQGSTFTVRLPSGPPGPTEDPPREIRKPARAVRVLVIDDQPEVRRVLRDLLTAEGYTVLEAADGPEGLARCAVEPVDLMVSDLSMPGMSGWEVAAACQARCPQVPVGFITGWGDQLDPEQLHRARVRFVLAKPFTRTDVLRQLAEVLPT